MNASLRSVFPSLRSFVFSPVPPALLRQTRCNFRPLLRTLAVVAMGAVMMLETSCSSGLQGIRTVSIDPKIYKPKSIAYSSRASQNVEIAGAATLGVLPILTSTVIAAGMTAGPRRRLQAAADGQQIQIDQIVKESFEQNLRRSGTFALGTPETSDAILSLDIGRYGVEYRGQKGLLTPLLQVDVELNRTKGRRAYFRRIGVNADPPLSRKPEEFAEHPEFFRAGLVNAADVAARQVLSEWGQRLGKTTASPATATKPAAQAPPGKPGR